MYKTILISCILFAFNLNAQDSGEGLDELDPIVVRSDQIGRASCRERV